MKKESWQTAQQFSVARMVAAYVSCFEQTRIRARYRESRAGLPDPFPLMPSCRSKYPFWLRKLKSRLLALRIAPGF
jgi:hypothetical protein